MTYLVEITTKVQEINSVARYAPTTRSFLYTAEDPEARDAIATALRKAADDLSKQV